MANLPPNHNEFTLAAEAVPDNMNGWVKEEEDPEMEEEEEDPEMEEEEEEMNANEEWDNLELTPLKRLFTNTQAWIGSSSFSATASHNPEDLTLSHIRSDLDALHRRVRHIEDDDVQSCAKAMRQASLEGLSSRGELLRGRADHEQGFMKCNPTVFHGHEGAVELSRWFEKMEIVFGISECAEARKVKFAAATLQGHALMWWNS
ncbi:hypothetical protein Tco_1569691 [Tanacetum coccineum]